MSAKIPKGVGWNRTLLSLQFLYYAIILLEAIDGNQFATEVDKMIEIAHAIDLNEDWFNLNILYRNIY